MADRGTYIKLSDNYPENRKVIAAGGDAAWLDVCAMTYASRNLTDGFVPKDMVPRLTDRRQPMKLAARLVAVDRWHDAGHGCKRCAQPPPDEYVIHDYLERQRSAAKVAEVSEKRAASGAKGGSKSKPKPKQVASDLLHDCSGDAEANGKPSFTEEVLRTSRAEEPLRGSRADTQPPSASAANGSRPAQPLSVTQRSKRLTDAYAAAEPMCKWPAVNSVVIRAIKTGEWPDEQIRGALLRMAEENRSVTIDSLRIELNGMPPLRGQNTPGESAGTRKARQALESGRRVQAAIDEGRFIP